MAGMQSPPRDLPSPSDARHSRAPRRVNGLAVLAALIVSGVGVTAGYLQWKAPEVHAIVDARRNEVAAAPTTPAGRLVHWLMYGNALIHNRLQEMRFSADRPWLVAYAVRGAGTERARPASSPDVEMYGVDLRHLPREQASIDGMNVVVRLPRACDLGRSELTGDNAPFVPVIAASEKLPDADQRARELAAWALKDLAQALERDISGAHLAIEVGPEASFDEITRSRANAAPVSDSPAPPR